MHILIIPSWYPKNNNDLSGVFFREQAQALKKSGLTVGVISISRLSLRKIKNILNFKKPKISLEIEDEIPTFRIFVKKWRPKLVKLYVKQHRTIGFKIFDTYVKQYGKPDIIHVHSMSSAGIVALEINRKYGIPYVVTEHFSKYLVGHLSKDQLDLTCRIAKHSSMNIAVSNSFAFALKKITEQPWVTIPNIVSERFFIPIKEKISQKPFVFISVGGLNKNKKIDLLIEAFDQAFNGDLSIQLRIGGTGKEFHNLQKLIAKKNLNYQITMLGGLTRSQVADEVGAANVFVSSSQHETFGVVLIEALALGKPVIATRSGGPEDIVKDYNGVLVPVNDSYALGSAMKDMIQRYNDFNSLAIQKGCYDTYSEEAVTQKLKSIYNQIL